MILSAIADKLKRRSKDDFKGRHFEASLIVQAVWACRKVFPRPICKGVALCRTCFYAIAGRNSAV
jgi:hypothetical protein